MLGDLENQYYEQDLPDKDYLAEEIAMNYLHLQLKGLIADLSTYACYDSTYFDNLTEET